MSGTLKSKTLKGTIWSTLERLSVQCVGFIVLIIMARLISPGEYGLVGMIAIFIDVAQSLVDSGFSQALIRKQDRSEVDNSTVFYFNIAAAVLLYVLLYAVAPVVSYFYKQPELCGLLRVVSLGIIINSFVVVQRALLTSNLNFKTQARASFIASLFSGVVGIGLAYAEYGVWALVAYQLSNYAVNSMLLWYYSSWRPIKKYSWSSFRELFSFGAKLAAAGLLNTIFTNMYLLVIGKFYSRQDVGYYTRAHQFGAFLSSNITQILQRVTYPALCSIQDETQRLLEAYKLFLRVSAYVVFPLMVGLGALSRPLVVTLLTEEWLFSARLLSVMCLAMMWFPIHAINLNLLQVMGYSNLFLRVEIIKKVTMSVIIAATVPFGMMAIVWGQLINSIISLCINTYYTGRIMHYGFLRQISDLVPVLCCSLTMGIVISIVIPFVGSDIMKMVVGVIAGAGWYLGISLMCKSPELKFILELFATKKRKK